MDSNQIEFALEPENNAALREFCGPHDDNLNQAGALASARVIRQGFRLTLMGEQSADLLRLKTLLESLYVEAMAGAVASEQIHRLWMAGSQSGGSDARIDTPQQSIEPRTEIQARFISRLHDQVVNFGIGPAGTGKTFLAVAYGVEGLRSGRFDRLVFCRPVLEAGERLGYLPGGIAEKTDPYMTPVYDALRATLGPEGMAKCFERHEIEIAPLAFMRGRTFDHSLILLDEAQNASQEQMRMFLTRIGRQAKAIITGDLTQSDLPQPGRNGLRHAVRVLHGVGRVSITRFTAADVVRSPIVERILRAYESDAEARPESDENGGASDHE